MPFFVNRDIIGTDFILLKKQEANMARFIYDRVYLLGIDGAGNFFTKTETPNIDRIFEGGAHNHFVLTSIPTISAQCWGSMLHGCSPAAHRLSNGIADTTPFPEDSLYPSIFKAARQKYPDAEFVSVSNWNAINVGIIEENLGVHKATGDDEKVCETVCEYIEKYDPKLLFVQFDSVDGAGHHYGYGTQGHLEQISTVDAYIGRIVDTAKRVNGLENTLILVTADHGGGSNHHHGGDSDAEKFVSFFASGKSVVPGEFGYMEIRDTSSVIAHALGINQPEHWSSRIPDSFFTDGISFERKTEARPDGTKKYSERLSLPTPTETGKTLADFTDISSTLCCLQFDNNLNDSANEITAEYDGKLYYTQGWYSQCVTLDDCSIKMSDIPLGTGNFTVCMWLKTDTVGEGKRCVFSTKSDADPYAEGIELYLENGQMNMIIGTGEKTSMKYSSPLPLNYENNWFHFIVSLDRHDNELCFYYDFYLDKDWYLECKLPETNTLNGKDCHVGNCKPFSIDDLLVYPYKLSDPQIEALETYYTQE